MTQSNPIVDNGQLGTSGKCNSCLKHLLTLVIFSWQIIQGDHQELILTASDGKGESEKKKKKHKNVAL